MWEAGGKRRAGVCHRSYPIAGDGTKAWGKGCDICVRPASLKERKRRGMDKEPFGEDQLQDLFSIFRLGVQGPLTLGGRMIIEMPSS